MDYLFFQAISQAASRDLIYSELQEQKSGRKDSSRVKTRHILGVAPLPSWVVRIKREQIRSARYNYLIPISEMFLVQQTGWAIVWSPSVCVWAHFQLHLGNNKPLDWEYDVVSGSCDRHGNHGNLHSVHEVSSNPTHLELPLLDPLRKYFILKFQGEGREVMAPLSLLT